MCENIRTIATSDEMREPRSKEILVIKGRVDLARKWNMCKLGITVLLETCKLSKHHAVVAIHKPADENNEVFAIGRGAYRITCRFCEF